MRQAPFIVIVCILAASLTSGCAGSGNTVQGSTFLHTGNASWYEYRINNPGLGDQYGTYDVMYMKYQFDNASYNGTVVPHFVKTQRYGVSPNVTYIDDFYWDPAGSYIVYERLDRLENGTVVQSAESGNLSYAYSYWQDTPDILIWAWNNTFTPAGKETLTVNGTAYKCDRYRGYDKPSDTTYIVWIDPAVPMPVKVSMEGSSRSTELMGWG